MNDRDRMILKLRASSPLRQDPKRTAAGRPIESQADVDGLALFDTYRSPDLFQEIKHDDK